MLQTCFLLALMFQPQQLQLANNVQVKKVGRHHIEIQYEQDNKKHSIWINQSQFVAVSVEETNQRLDGIRRVPQDAVLLRIDTTSRSPAFILAFTDYNQAKRVAEDIVKAAEN